DDEPEPDTSNLPHGPGINPHNYVKDEHDKYVHKASICRLVLNKAFVAKSKDRVDRVKG
ncbi:hypothetical protein R3P38DRAFT_2472803, partial [Favolaschia claudopus]